MPTRLPRLALILTALIALGACGGGGSSAAAPAATGDQSVKGVSVPAQISVVTATE